MKLTFRYTSLVAGGLLALAMNVYSEGILDSFSLKTVADAIKPLTDSGKSQDERQADGETLDPASDKLCDSLDRAYTVTESFTGIAKNALICKIKQCTGNETIPKSSAELETWLRNYSHKNVWIPVPLEEALGAASLDQLEKAELIAARGPKNNARLYAKADKALDAAKASYPSNPYTLKVYITEVTDLVNASAKPGGYIFVTRAAASDLDDNALQLVIGHEIAHLAKRHTSKQLQERLLDTVQGVDVFKQMSKLGDTKYDIAVANQILEKLGCSFATYDQDQESQADACSARVMVNNNADPIAAWKEFVRVRGTVADAKPAAAAPRSASSSCLISSETHPTDDTREKELLTAAAHHRSKTAAR